MPITELHYLTIVCLFIGVPTIIAAAMFLPGSDKKAKR